MKFDIRFWSGLPGHFLDWENCRIYIFRENQRSFYCHLIIFSRKICGLYDTLNHYVCQTEQVHFACGITKISNSPRICNIYCFSMATMVTRTHRTVTLYVQCVFCSILRPISVHIHSVFCVPCTVCVNVQHCTDTAVRSGNCSAVWDAVSVQYTWTEGSESVHVHHQVPNKRAF